MRVNSRPIMLVEDDQVDILTVRRALKEIAVRNPVVVRENGEDALAYLRDRASARPCIVLLDLNMPVMNGLEFLQQARRDEQLRSIPVIVLTTSEEPHDKTRSFALGADGYMAKPLDYRRFVDMMRSIERYWCASELP